MGEGEFALTYTVQLNWDTEAGVWVATSEDIPGLALESGSFDALIERVRFAAQELLALNGTEKDILWGKGGSNMPSNLAYQEEKRMELIGGKLVAMSPRPTFQHNRIAENIDFIFRTYLKGKRCVPFGDGYDLFLTDTDHYVPDFMVVCDREKIKPDGVHGAPDLVVEVLSPSTSAYDKGHKKRVYEACGVPEYWIVSPEARSVDVYRLKEGRYELEGSYTVYPDYILQHMTEEEQAAIPKSFKCHLYDDLTVSLSDIFDELLDL